MQYSQYKLFYNMNLEYYKYDKKYRDNETNFIFNKVINNFIDKYKDYFNKNFILYYTDDIVGLISYYLLSTISQVSSEFQFKIYCNNKIKKTLKYLDKKLIIKKLKIKNNKNTIFLSTFNPLYYVINETKVSNFLNSNNSMVSLLTPEQIKNIAEYYNINDKGLLSIFENPLVKNFSNFCNGDSCNLLNLYPNVGYLYNNNNPKILIYNLKGDESDFPIFDEIIEKSKNNLIFYNCKEEYIDAIISQLAPYIEGRNIPRRGFNVNISEDLFENFNKQREEIFAANNRYADSLKKMKIGG